MNGVVAIRRWFLGLCVVFCPVFDMLGLVRPLNAQDATVFRGEVNLVVQAVTVTGDDGRPLEGLTAADFIVTENGVPQEMAFIDFQRVTPDAGSSTGTSMVSTLSRPTGSRAARPAPSRYIDVRYPDRRLVVMYFDLSALSAEDEDRAYQGVLDFIDREMTPSDMVALMTFQRGVVSLGHDFTDDRDRLRSIIQLWRYTRPGAVGHDQAFGQNDAEFNLFNTNRQLSALQTAVTMFSDNAQRTTLIYFSSGLPLNGTENQAQFRATVNASILANVTINPVDARGLTTVFPLGDASRPSPQGVSLFSGSLALNGLRTFQRSQDVLYALAEDTGGVARFDDNNLGRSIAEVTRTVTSYYVLAYYSTHTEPDGQIRQVEIALTGDRSATLSYRREYVGKKVFADFTEADKERQLEEAMMLANPITDLTVALELNHFQLNRAEYYVPVFIKIPGSELELDRGRGGSRLTLDVIAEIRTSYHAVIQNVRDTVDVALNDAMRDELRTRPVQYETGFTLLPDDYIIRLLVRDAASGKLGTYETTFVVPNLEREESLLPLSSVVLSSHVVPLGDELLRIESDATPAVNPLVRDGHKVVPSVTRVFSQRQDLEVLAEAYQRANAAATRPLVTYVALYSDDRKILETAPLVATDGTDTRSWAVPLRLTMPLTDVPRGRFQCQVTVLDPTGQKVVFWRAPVIVAP